MSMDTSLIFHIAAFGLILIGSAGIVLSTHLVRIIFGIALLEAGANLLLLLATYREGAAAPIIVDGRVPLTMADPVPQALVLTAIVIGVGILALALSLSIPALAEEERGVEPSPPYLPALRAGQLLEGGS